MTSGGLANGWRVDELGSGVAGLGEDGGLGCWGRDMKKAPACGAFVQYAWRKRCQQ